MTSDPPRRGDEGPLGFGDDDEPGSEGAIAGGPADPLVVPPPARRPPQRASWIVGTLIVAALIYISLNTLQTVGSDEAVGSRGLPASSPLPPFAMPLALSDLEGDANVARRPDSGDAGSRPACEVRSAQILNVCELAEKGPVVLAFLATRGSQCTRQLDLMERARPRFPGVQFAGVGLRGDRDDLRELVSRKGWDFPVGYDADGVVANLYGVSVCPTVTFAYPGGIAMRTTVGLLGERGLRLVLRRLVAGARDRGWTPPA